MIIVVFSALVLAAGFLGYRHWKTQTGTNEEKFLKGTIPAELPDGLYHGSVTGLKTTWQGKKFDRAKQTGINVFAKNGVTADNYPFKTYVADGLADPQVRVIKIDYNLPSNPLWLRFILDEIVQVAPDEYLGKLHIRTPLVSIALGYFTLKK